MHGLVVAHRLLKIEFILFIDLGGKWGIGFLCALPRRALVVQMAGVALLDERKILSSFRERLARCNLFRFFKRFAGLAVNLPIIWACPMARFTTDTDQKLVWLRNFIAAFRPEPGHVTAYTIFVFGVVFLRVKFRLDHRGVLFLVPVGFERIDRFGMCGLDP